MHRMAYQASYWTWGDPAHHPFPPYPDPANLRCYVFYAMSYNIHLPYPPHPCALHTPPTPQPLPPILTLPISISIPPPHPPPPKYS